MKYVLAFALLFLVVMCTGAVGDEGSDSTSPPEDGQLKKMTLETYLEIFGRLMRFQRGIMAKIESGELKIEELKEAFKKAVDSGSECFYTELMKSKGILTDLAEKFQQIFRGGDGTKTGTETNTANSNASTYDYTKLLEKIGEFVQAFVERLDDPVVKEEIKEIGLKLRDAALVAKDCFVDAVKTNLPEDKFNVLSKTWKESD